MADQVLGKWAIVEVFDGSRIAGIVDQTGIDQGFVTVNVPAVGEKEGFNALIRTDGIFLIVPVSKEIAMDFVARFMVNRVGFQIW